MGTHNERSERGAAALDLPLLLLLVSQAYFFLTYMPTRKSTLKNGGFRGTSLRGGSFQNPDVGGPASDAGVLVMKPAG